MTRVAGQEPTNRGKAQRRRNGAAVAVSLLAHLVVFALIGFNAPRLIAPPAPPLLIANVWLMPRLTLQQHKPAEHKPAASRAALTSTTVKAASPRPANPALAQRAPATIPAPPAAARAPSPAPAAEGEGGGVREALRTSVGCDAEKVVHLTPGERDRCNQYFGAEARKQPPFSGIEINKRARFDAQADADERRRAARNGPMQDLVVPCAGEGSNLGGGCLPDSAIMHAHQP